MTSRRRPQVANVEPPREARDLADHRPNASVDVLTSPPQNDHPPQRAARPGRAAWTFRGTRSKRRSWSELGGCRRFSRSDQAVRHTGLDVSVDASDLRRAGRYLSRQGPPVLRWALVEAAINASHRHSPDHAYYIGRAPIRPPPQGHADQTTEGGCECGVHDDRRHVRG
jgi:Transposase IS116/IS110/IS902 family